MKLVIKPYGALCELKKFTINGIDAVYEDFGEKYDHEPTHAEDYCCGDMRFEAKNSTLEILDKYFIDEDEYDKICGELGDALDFGSCGWCS